MRIAVLVVFACCTLFSLVTAGLVFSFEQPGSAAFFGCFGLFFSCLAAVTIRKKDAGGSDATGIGNQRHGFVPHWFVITALFITVVFVVGSILWRLMH